MKMPKSFKAKALIASVAVLVAGGTFLGLTLNNPQPVEKDTVKLTTSVSEPKEEVQSAATEVVEQTPVPQSAPQTQAVEEPAPTGYTTEEMARIDSWKGFSIQHVYTRRLEVGKKLPVPMTGVFTPASLSETLPPLGVSVVTAPAAHDLIVIATAGNGHVAFVEEVNADESIWVSEMGSRGQVSKTDTTVYGGFNKVDWKVIPADQVSRYKILR